MAQRLQNWPIRLLLGANVFYMTFMLSNNIKVRVPPKLGYYLTAFLFSRSSQGQIYYRKNCFPTKCHHAKSYLDCIKIAKINPYPNILGNFFPVWLLAPNWSCPEGDYVLDSISPGVHPYRYVLQWPYLGQASTNLFQTWQDIMGYICTSFRFMVWLKMTDWRPY